MNKQALVKSALSVKASLREMHGLLDDTPELEDHRYLTIITMMNELRVELFASLAMIGVEIPMTEREVAPGDGQAATKKRDWAVDAKPRSEPVSQTTTASKNPFAGNGFGGKAW